MRRCDRIVAENATGRILNMVVCVSVCVCAYVHLMVRGYAVITELIDVVIAIFFSRVFYFYADHRVYIYKRTYRNTISI